MKELAVKSPLGELVKPPLMVLLSKVNSPVVGSPVGKRQPNGQILIEGSAGVAAVVWQAAGWLPMAAHQL